LGEKTVRQSQREKKIYTIDDVARELGISKTTVSRAISGKGRLSAETRAKVLDFIKEHNYHPNAVAKSLAQSRTNNIGLILPGEKERIDFSFFQECTLGICQAASERDYDVLSIVDDHSTERVQQILDNQKVDGIIATRSEIDSPILSLLKAQHLPFTVIGSSSDHGVLCVDNDNRNACRDLVSLLISRGIRRMALFGGSENHCVTHSRLQGFRDACHQAELPEQLVLLNLTSGPQIADAVEQAAVQQIECIICMDDFICSLTLLQLRMRRMSVPQDVKLACMYDSALLAQTSPSVTSLRFDAIELGRAACQELLNLLNGQNANSYVLPGYQLLLRDSTR